MKILIAEDDQISRKFLFKFLSQYGDVDMVVDGYEAIEAVMIAFEEETLYDLICMDIMMPKMDGVKALRTIRELEKQRGLLPEKRAKIIMTTALAETQFVQQAFEYGCEAYAAKPIDIHKLTDVLRKLDLIG